MPFRTTSATLSTFVDLQRGCEAHLPLDGLSGEAYARGHALFEARSDQRALLTEWLWARLAPRAGAPVRVLSVGCGDGSVDAELAHRLRDAGSEVTYDGVEPFAGSAQQWRSRLGRLDGVTSSLQQVRFAEHEGEGPYDVVVFVHSLYYVPDVAEALRAAVALLAPGGELLVLHAPRAALNALVELLAPSTGGHPQWFSDKVVGALRGIGSPYASERLHAELDLVGAGDEVLDFTVQAVLPVAVRELVLAHLAEVAPQDLDVPHPVDAFVLPRPGSEPARAG